MPYISNSPDDQKKMLEQIGLGSTEELFAPIPEPLRLKKSLNLPPPLSEPELVRHLTELSHKNQTGELSFLGGGIYRHFIPAVVWNLAMRPEFATAYTPYQAEVAQGTLQVIYEFQTHICRLTGMDVANASMYDGATATAEAALLAVNHTGRDKIVVSQSVNPFYIDVLKAMLAGKSLTIETIPLKNGGTDFGVIDDLIDDRTACLIVSQPNSFGYLEDLERGEKAIHAAGGLLVTVFDPISLGLLKTPAAYGADIAVAEGQSLGIPANFGGPLLGLFACRQEFIRRLPGRLVGRTVDVDGRPGFVLTLQTREQHIRRDKATSNICTNEALCATAATIYLSLMGRQGLARVARLAAERAHYLAEKVATLDGYGIWTNQPFFKEFVIETPLLPSQIVAALGRVGIAAGIDLGCYFPRLDHHLQVAVTEMVSFEDCDRFVAQLSAVAAGRPLIEKAYAE